LEIGDSDRLIRKYFLDRVNGTDGILFPPYVTREMILQAVVPDLCRSIYFEYTEDVTHDGIPTYRYRQPKRMYQPLTNPDNW
jgi:hypothetical protein